MIKTKLRSLAVTLFGKENNVFKRVIKEASFLVVGDIVSAIISFISLAILLNYISPTVYGTLTLIMSYVLLVDSLVNFQTWQALIKFGSEKLHEEDHLGFMSLIKSSFLIDISTAILGGILAFLLVDVCFDLIGIDPYYINYLKVYCFTICFHLIGMPTGVLRLFKRFDLLMMHKITIAIVKFVPILLLTLLEWDPNTVIIIYMISSLIEYTSLFLLALYVLKKNGYSKWLSAKTNLQKPYISFVLYSNLTSSINVPTKRLDVFFISNFLSVEMVSVYKFMQQIITYIDLIAASIYKAIYPHYATLIAKREYKGAFSLFKKIFILFLCVLIPILILFPFILEPIIKLLFGDFYASKWIIIMFFVAAKGVIYSFVGLDPLFMALGYQKQNFYLTLFSNLMYLGILYLLIQTFGIYGVIIAIFVEGLFINVSKLIYVRRKN
ncbi:oligosaccharide flippase family protein [Eubacteriales bacterium OttesenSCG-928-M02]|nr:oligosaccharide flippase family protein [Eubacteriales bacterium OttesenSCG-928-M02]